MRRALSVQAVMIAIAACALCLSASPAAASTKSAGSRSSQVVLSVAPIPTTANRAPGTPQVTWSTGNGSPGLVTVSTASTGETPFASGSAGTSAAPWIAVGQTYLFRLYSTASGRQLLARLQVGHAAAVQVVALPPNPRITSAVINRVLQVLSFAMLPLLAALAALHIRAVRRDG